MECFKCNVLHLLSYPSECWFWCVANLRFYRKALLRCPVIGPRHCPPLPWKVSLLIVQTFYKAQSCAQGRTSLAGWVLRACKPRQAPVNLPPTYPIGKKRPHGHVGRDWNMQLCIKGSPLTWGLEPGDSTSQKNVAFLAAGATRR